MFKKLKFSTVIILVILNILFNFPLKVVANSSESMREVRSGWDVMPIYEISHPPGPKCIGENNDLYYMDNLNKIMMKMDEFGAHTEYLNVSLSLSDIIYQPIHQRFIGINNFAFYAITSSNITLLKNYSYIEPLTTMTVDPTDDSFYCGSIKNDTDILKFDAGGIYLTNLHSNIQGCSQIILNNNQSILYYAETYLGSISMMNLTSSVISVLKTGIGLPGTQEVIGIGVDDIDDLYYMTADGNDRGFYKYENNTFTFLMSSKAGMSTLLWSTKLKTFIAAGSVGGCLISYDPEGSEAELLTPFVNSRTIIETSDGKILYSIEDTIYKINESGPTYFSKNPYFNTIFNLIVDIDNNVYALVGKDSVAILKINFNGSFEDWFISEIDEWAKSIHYDEKNNEIILITENSLLNESYVYRLPINNPMEYYKVTTFENSTKITGVTDNKGNIYIYEAYKNTLFLIPDGSIDREIITTDFIDFSDIYGIDIIIEPPLGYCSIENGILIGRNDDVQMWLLDENIRITFAINNRGIDNSAFHQNFNQEIICTQSTLIIKFIYQKPPKTTISALIYAYFLPISFAIVFAIYIQKRKKMKVNLQ